MNKYKISLEGNGYSLHVKREERRYNLDRERGQDVRQQDGAGGERVAGADPGGVRRYVAGRYTGLLDTRGVERDMEDARKLFILSSGQPDHR